MSNGSPPPVPPHPTPGIRAACLWGDALEHRVDFDASDWFERFDDEDILSHFETTVRVGLPDGDFTADFPDEHPEWGRVELVTERMDDDPAFAEMLRWLEDKGTAGGDGEEEKPLTELISVYVSRADALAWLRANRPDIYLDIRSTYAVPPADRRFFP